MYARFLLTHLRDPAAGVALMRAALRPGGRIVLEDIDYRGSLCYPESDVFRRTNEIYEETARRNGGDPHVGIRLARLLLDAGFERVQPSIAHPVGLEGEVKLLPPLTIENIKAMAVAPRRRHRPRRSTPWSTSCTRSPATPRSWSATRTSSRPGALSLVEEGLTVTRAARRPPATPTPARRAARRAGLELGGQLGQPLVVLAGAEDRGVERGLLLGDPLELLVEARQGLAGGPLLGAAGAGAVDRRGLRRRGDVSGGGREVGRPAGGGTRRRRPAASRSGRRPAAPTPSR